MARENAGPAIFRPRGYGPKTNGRLRRYQHRQARQEARLALRGVAADESTEDT
jgi:hypothetical protein